MATQDPAMLGLRQMHKKAVYMPSSLALLTEAKRRTRSTYLRTDHVGTKGAAQEGNLPNLLLKGPWCQMEGELKSATQHQPKWDFGSWPGSSFTCLFVK